MARIFQYNVPMVQDYVPIVQDDFPIFSRFSFQFFKLAKTSVLVGPVTGPLEVIAEALTPDRQTAGLQLELISKVLLV